MSVPVLTQPQGSAAGDLRVPGGDPGDRPHADFQLDCVSKEVQQEVFGPELDTSSLRIG